MNVLVFTSLYPNNIWPNNGIFIQERMTNFAKLNGCKVKVIAPVPYFPPINLSWRSKYSQVMRREIREGLEVFHPRYFITPKIGMSLYGLKMFLSVLPTVKKIQKNFDFDIIDAHYIYPDGFAAVLLGKYLRKPVVVSARGSDINLFTEFPVIRKLLKYTLRSADHIISVSGALKEAIVQLAIPGRKIAIVPNGVSMDKFFSSPKEEARSKLSIPNKKVILSVGNLTQNKGFDLLIKALKILFEKFYEKDLYLIIVGEGVFRKELEKLISTLNLGEHVRLIGSIPHQELKLWYNAADIFCLASDKEGWPNVILEALACGKPVIATSVGGIPEILCTKNVGLLTERNEHDIAMKISIALKFPWQTNEITQYAKEYTWHRAAISVYRVFKSVLDGYYLNHSNLSQISH